MSNFLENKWKTYSIKDIFEIKKVIGKPIEKYDDGMLPYISTSATNNGLVGFVSGKDISIKNAISVDPIKGTAFFHCYDFVGRGFSGASISLLYNKKMNKYSGLFMCKMIETTAKRKATYGNLFNSNRLAEAKILLPADVDGNPDYNYMEKYIKEKEKKMVQKYIVYFQNNRKASNLKQLEIEWKEFKICDAFKMISRGKRLKKGDHINGDIPYVSSTMLNNGIDGFIGNENGKRFSNCLTIANSGSVGCSFYHPYEFIGSDHITALKDDRYNKYAYLFMSVMLKRLGEKYSFNREINDYRINKEKILIPINKENGKIAFDYMEQYVKKLIDNKIIKYLEYKQQLLSE